MYYAALTEGDAERRDALWADLFRALGQIMHLVVDASVPEHSRNDMHPLGAMKIENSYERWVADQHHPGGAQETAFVGRYLALPVGFARDVLAQSGMAGLVDADRYDGTNPHVTVGADSRSAVAIGLAEIANANFFSEDTLRGQYPSPTDAGLIPVKLTTPLGKVRRYFSRPAGQGLLPANPLKAECASDAIHLRGAPISRPPYPCVDPLVWNQVAMHMLPRAVGYARGVLDYFFRGSMAVTDVTWDDSGVRVGIQNTSNEEMEGLFEIWARHDPDTSAERRTKLATLGGGERIRLVPGQRYTFGQISIPAGVEPSAKQLLVFKGRLGTEDDAVVAQVFTVPYVDIRQTIYTATTGLVCGAPTGTTAPLPFPKTTTTIRTSSLVCSWRINQHYAAGTLTTNMPIDPATGHPERILNSVEARWTGSATPSPLAVDGRPVSGAWRRQGTEPDPSSFEITDTTPRSQSATLVLLVTYTTGRQVQVVQMARVGSASVGHEKMMLLDNRVADGPTLVATRRSVIAFLSYDWTRQFEIISHNGVPPPFSNTTQRAFGNTGVAEGVFANQFVYLEMAIDDFRVFSDPSAADRFYGSFVLTSPHPSGPSYGWEAEVRRRYLPAERDFLRAFVIAEPVPFTVRIGGTGAAGTQ